MGRNHEKLYSTYTRVKTNCCKEWKNSAKFYEWYDEQEKRQNNKCAYCGLLGDTKEKYGKYYREGKRGKRLEVDRKDDKKYSPKNCHLVCYPCNNAKSDVFKKDEFIIIGKVIGAIKGSKEGKAKLIKENQRLFGEITQ